MKKYTSLVLGLCLILFLSAFLRGEEETKYSNESFARLSFFSGKAFVQRGAEAKFEEAMVNAPLEDGNTVGTTDGRAEIYFGKSNYARLDNNTKLEIVNLPKKDSNVVRLRVLNGSIYLSVNQLDQEKSIEIHAPDASFYVLNEGLYRIDVRENKKTEVLVFYGMIEAAGEEGSQLLKSEQSLEASQGRFASRPRRFYAVAEDSFDRWNESRDASVRPAMAKGYLPEELKDFEGELDQYGSWTYLRPYGWVWVPSGVDSDWRPYYNGNWVWLSLGGWTWLPYEPWGWAPFHYGRWGWGAGLGWYWMPMTFWGPAWVGWWWGYDYWGWAPLSWWGYPGVLYDGYYYGRWNGNYPYYSRALTVVHKDQLRAKNIPGVALRSDSLKGLNKMTLTGQAPTIRPAEQRISAASLGAGKVYPQRESRGSLAGTTGVRAPSLSGRERGGTIQSPERGGQTGRASGERGIGAGESSRRSGPQGDQRRGSIRKNAFGYPSSPEISVRKYGQTIQGSRSSSVRSRFYNYIQGNRSSSRSSSARGSSSRGSISSSRSRGSSSSGSRGSISSGSRGGFSGGSHSSGSRSSGGGIRHRG